MNDLISRQAAIDAYGDWYVEEGTEEGFIGTVKQLLKGLPSAQPETCAYWDRESNFCALHRPSAEPVIRCKDCKHKPYPSDNYDYDNGDCGFEIIFPDYRCPCRCDDEYYNRIPDDDWFCGNAERRTDAADRC